MSHVSYATSKTKDNLFHTCMKKKLLKILMVFQEESIYSIKLTFFSQVFFNFVFQELFFFFSYLEDTSSLQDNTHSKVLNSTVLLLQPG